MSTDPAIIAAGSLAAEFTEALLPQQCRFALVIMPVGQAALLQTNIANEHVAEVFHELADMVTDALTPTQAPLQ